MVKHILRMTGLQHEDLKPSLMSFLALFFLLLSYYLVKPLRDSRFFMYFNADQLPFFYLVSPIAALIITKIFNFFVERVSARKLLIITYGLMAACKVAFTLLMQFSNAWSTAVFFIWASVYFSLVLSILWATINSAFASEQAERCFGLIAIGATLGGIVGSKVSGLLVESVLKDWTLLLSVLSMVVALGLTLLIPKGQSQKSQNSLASAEAEDTPKTTAKVSSHSKPGPWDDIKSLLQRPYMRGIAFMVFALALASTVVNLQVYQQIDDVLARQTYQQVFRDWDPEQQHFAEIRELKGKAKPQVTAALQALNTHVTPDHKPLEAQYTQYQSQLEGETRKLFANVYFWQGILGIILLGVVARILFQYVGLSWSTILLPCFFVGVLILLFFPLETLVLQGILIGAGALNYSLNNATKELLYTPTTPQARYQHKPLIEGPIMRLGDVSASIFKIGVAGSLAGTIVLSHQWQSRILLSIGLIASVLWIVMIWYTGRQYDKNQQAEIKSQELDLA